MLKICPLLFSLEYSFQHSRSLISVRLRYLRGQVSFAAAPRVSSLLEGSADRVSQTDEDGGEEIIQPVTAAGAGSRRPDVHVDAPEHGEASKWLANNADVESLAKRRL